MKEDKRPYIFTELRKIYSAYSPPLTVTSDSDLKYELYSKKPIQFMGRKFPEMYFGSVCIQSKYVGLYFMPVYAKPELLEDMPERLRKCLKGKSCFHIKEWDAELEKMVKEAVKDGFNCYKKLEFV